MFGMGFVEMLAIAIIAILFLGPDKLPGAMVDVAKFFRSAKNAIGSVKDTLEEEIHVSDIKKEALAYKAQLEEVKATVDVKSQLNNLNSSILDDDEVEAPQNVSPKEPQEVTFKKKKKKDSYAEVENV